MSDEKVLYEVKDKIAWITLNRPESLNAVNRDMVKSIVGYCREAEEDPKVQVLIFKAKGERAFSVGGDIKDRARQNAVAVEQTESPLVQRQAKNTAIPGTPAPAIFASRPKARGSGSAKCASVSWQALAARSGCLGWLAFQRLWKSVFPANYMMLRNVTASAW